MLKLVHVELKEANGFVASFHRHHKPVVGHRFSLGARGSVGLVGVVIVGRPVARMTDQINTVEVTRLCTDGTKNACSFLYSAAARAAATLGYTSIQTFILESEGGVSLRASGWKLLGISDGGDWNCRSRGNRRTDQPQEPKRKYGKMLGPRLVAGTHPLGQDTPLSPAPPPLHRTTPLGG